MTEIHSPTPIPFPNPQPSNLPSISNTTSAASSSSLNRSASPAGGNMNGNMVTPRVTNPSGANQRGAGDSLPNIGDIDGKCGGCGNLIDQEGGGVVVAFGSSLWHVDCFKCAKCKEKVSADTNLLLLSDGSPVCGNCSYQCFVCKQAITEEAIMTGDESYHAHCFTCRTCKRRIEELVFAKTSQGIYCMSCHNERVAKSRRHAEAKRQRAARKEREAREKDEGGVHRREDSSSRPIPIVNQPNDSSSPSGSPMNTPISQDVVKFPDASPRMVSSSEEDHTSNYQPRSRELSVDNNKMFARANSPNGSQRGTSPNGLQKENPLPPLPQSPSDAAFYPKQMDKDDQRSLNSGRDSPITTNISPSMSPSSSRSPTVGLGVGINLPSSSSTSKADRRRSINPTMTFNLESANANFGNEPKSTPLPPSPLRSSFTDLSKPRIGTGGPLRSPTSPTPQHLSSEGFPFKAPPLSTSAYIQRSVTPDGTGSHPPRKSSLPETTFANIQPRTRSHSASVPVREEMEEVINLDSNENNQKDQDDIVGDNDQTPSSNPPKLPAMSFSLSDPEFALILNGIEQNGDTEDVDSKSSRETGNGNGLNIDLNGSPPSSPSVDGISRSPQMPTLSEPLKDISNQQPHSSNSVSSISGSPSRSNKLNPNISPGPMLRTRQPSAESTDSIHSISGRLGPDSAFSRIVNLVEEGKSKGKERLEVDLSVLSGIVSEIEDLREVMAGLKNKYTGAKRTSQQYSEGLTVAGEEYDKEVAIRRELEAEITRLKAQVHSQTARLSVISGDERRAENMRRRSNDLANSLTGLERDISRLRAQRDMTLAEVEELQNNRNSSGAASDATESVSQSLTTRLDTIKEQYREELEPLTAQREALQREIAELRESKEQFLEESTALAAKNEELAELNAQLSRQAESLHESLSRKGPTIFSKRSHPSNSPSLSSLATSATLHEVPEETARVVKVTKPDPQPLEAAPARRFKWYGYKSSKGPIPETSNNSTPQISRPMNVSHTNGTGSAFAGLVGAGGMGANIAGPSSLGSSLNGNLLGMRDNEKRLPRPSTEMGLREHQFQQHSTMRFTRCELCTEKMWGLQEVRCGSCGIVCHSKCVEKLPRSCTGNKNGSMQHDDGPLPPSMFGRDLSEQAASDRTDVPVIVTKSISAVEEVGMEYEGIYRKTGGSSQSKQIQQLFERGDYDAFDLADVEAFNDISSVTSVLKTYFRQLPNPLLTHALHESFVAASTIKDLSNRHTALTALLKELPKEHYNTLRALMIHLNRVMQASGTNLMTSQNLGVVFGPTLMRSSDPNREFGDMGGKAMCIQWMVENAPSVFVETRQ